MNIIISGTHGLIGTALTNALQNIGHTVYPLIRSNQPNPRELYWDPLKKIIQPDKFPEVDVIINLAGASIGNARWTRAEKRNLWDSRIESAKLLCSTIAQLPRPPQMVISASAVGFYGSRGPNILTEESSKGSGFLSDLCETWENEFNSLTTHGINVSFARFGVVLSPYGGALKKMLFPFKMGLGGKLGSGAQFMSWISLQDCVESILFIIKHNLQGPINVTSPNPITNTEFTSFLALSLKRPAVFNVPTAVLKILFGEMAEELLLSSARAVPQKLLNCGFCFTHSNVKDYFKAVLVSTAAQIS